jgi:phytoene dehydrogenase-like protein
MATTATTQKTRGARCTGCILNTGVLLLLALSCSSSGRVGVTAFAPQLSRRQSGGEIFAFRTTTTNLNFAPRTVTHSLEQFGSFQYTTSSSSSTSLSFFKRLFGRRNKKDGESTSTSEEEQTPTPKQEATQSEVTTTPPPPPAEEVDLCIIGAGVSGLTAALTAADKTKMKPKNIIVLEQGAQVGGRVTSDKTADGYILDRGFAVFLEEYPLSKQLLDYEALDLRQFLPGALIKTKSKSNTNNSNMMKFERVADPLRIPLDLFTALFADVGTFADKVRVLKLILKVRINSVEELFKDPETDTLTCLRKEYGFSDKFIDEFMTPFLEGIYLAPLNEQSSRMFHFVFKMFSEGAAALPAKGMQAVSDQLAQKCTTAGVDIRLQQSVHKIGQSSAAESAGGYTIELLDDSTTIHAKSIIVATDGKVATKLIGDGLDEFASIIVSSTDGNKKTDLPQRKVACRYYGFQGPPPISDPILVLNGERRTDSAEDYDLLKNPVNNLCFPSILSQEYAPAGYSLCSVTILAKAMDLYKDQSDEVLDVAVRKQLSEWFPTAEYKNAILNKENNGWQLKGSYSIPNAQPAQKGGPWAANVNGGRDAKMYRGKKLPPGIMVCGDHMATATLNGALESGVNAGTAAAAALKK